jgi:DNA topoisomerase-1
LMEIKFTALMEEELDKISEGERGWLEALRRFYSLLSLDLAKASETRSIKAQGIPVEEKCPRCGRPLVIKEGRYGRFKACSGYPECTYKEGLRKAETKSLEETCPQCGAQLVQKKGRYGFFVACSNYPQCRYIKSQKAEKIDTGLACPWGCGGTIVQRKTKRGKVFYGCSKFPRCRFATWDEPVNRPCPRCAKPILFRKSGKSGQVLYCLDEKCGFRQEGGDAEKDEQRA